MAKEQITEITDWIYENFKTIKEIFYFIIVVTMGAFTKIINEIKKGTKPTFSWFISEGIISFFVAITVYAVFDQFLQVNKLFSYVMCAWGGSFSNLFTEKFKDLITSFFDYLKVWLKTKLS